MYGRWVFYQCQISSHKPRKLNTMLPVGGVNSPSPCPCDFENECHLTLSYSQYQCNFYKVVELSQVSVSLTRRTAKIENSSSKLLIKSLNLRTFRNNFKLSLEITFKSFSLKPGISFFCWQHKIPSLDVVQKNKITISMIVMFRSIGWKEQNNQQKISFCFK